VKKLAISLAGMALVVPAAADNLVGVDKMICAAGQVHICVENDTCYPANAAELGVPDFVIIDLKKKVISTTRASDKQRSTPFKNVDRADGLVYLQGVEGRRAFSFMIDEATGRMTVSVARDGVAVSVFGACTDAEL
jgi:hypothetical protein